MASDKLLVYIHATCKIGSGAMDRIEIPDELMVDGRPYNLHIEAIGDAVTLTYEHEPIQEDSYLLAVYGLTIEQATQSMLHHLKLNQIMN